MIKGMTAQSLGQGDKVRLAGDEYGDFTGDVVTVASVTPSSGFVNFITNSGYSISSSFEELQKDGYRVVPVVIAGKNVADVAYHERGNIVVRFEDGEEWLWRLDTAGYPEGKWERGRTRLTSDDFYRRLDSRGRHWEAKIDSGVNPLLTKYLTLYSYVSRDGNSVLNLDSDAENITTFTVVEGVVVTEQVNGVEWEEVVNPVQRLRDVLKEQGNATARYLLDAPEDVFEAAFEEQLFDLGGGNTAVIPGFLTASHTPVEVSV